MTTRYQHKAKREARKSPHPRTEVAASLPAVIRNIPAQPGSVVDLLRQSVANESKAADLIPADVRERVTAAKADAKDSKRFVFPKVARDVIKASQWTIPPQGDSLGALLRMMESMRPHGTSAPNDMAQEFIAPLGAQPDKKGNYILAIGDSPRVLWSSHLDTVHYKSGRQRLAYNNDVLRLSRHAKDTDSNCLGADCTVGAWLMREMVRANRPGLYIWHAGEELGGIGSRYIADQSRHLLKDIDAAVAFDRRGNRSIITHQSFERTCSEGFARSLGSALAMGHTADDTGSFTDTANYSDFIAECSNLSVGYVYEHTDDEMLDVPYLFALRAALLGLDASTLTIERNPYKPEFKSYGYAGLGASYYAKADKRRTYSYDTGSKKAVGWYDWNDDDDSDGRAFGAQSSREESLMRKLIKDNPAEIAKLLESYGIDLSEAADFVFACGGAIPTDLLDGSLDSGDDDSEVIR